MKSYFLMKVPHYIPILYTSKQTVGTSVYEKLSTNPEDDDDDDRM